MKLKSNVAISDTGFIFNPSSGESFSLNPIGVEILSMIKENTPNEFIIKELCKKYQAESNTIEKDLYDFLSMLKTYSLLEDENKKA